MSSVSDKQDSKEKKKKQTIMAVEATTAWIPPPNTDSAMTGRASLNCFRVPISMSASTLTADTYRCPPEVRQKEAYNHIRDKKRNEQEVTILA